MLETDFGLQEIMVGDQGLDRNIVNCFQGGELCVSGVQIVVLGSVIHSSQAPVVGDLGCVKGVAVDIGITVTLDEWVILGEVGGRGLIVIIKLIEVLMCVRMGPSGLWMVHALIVKILVTGPVNFRFATWQVGERGPFLRALVRLHLIAMILERKCQLT